MTAFNQAGALVHIYKDGSIHLNHGGTEMGQGLYVKVAQVLADTFQVDLDKVKITATTTAKVPNTSATAASSGSDLNGMAAQNAARQIKARLVAFAAEKYGVAEDAVVFEPNCVLIGNQRFDWADFIDQAYFGRVQLSAAGFYKTPDIHWDRAAGKGNPFFYFAYGASCSEVIVDTLTGEYVIERADILHDMGRSLNGHRHRADRGRVHTGHGVADHRGVVGRQGRLRTHAPRHRSARFGRAENLQRQARRMVGKPGATIGRSKAVGEPPFMLAMSVPEALSMAAASVVSYAIPRAWIRRQRPSGCDDHRAFEAWAAAR